MGGTANMEATAASDRPVDAGAFGAAVVAAVGLAWWRRRPWACWAVTFAAALVYTARAYPGGPIYVAAAVGVYAAAVRLARSRAYALAGLLGVVLFATSLAARGEVAGNDVLFLAWPAVAVLVADAVRGRQERATAAAERQRFARRERESDLRRERAEERLALARDLHDSVAHSLAAINVQAGVAAHVLGRDPARAGPALEAIRVASRDVLDELAVLLKVLRDGEAAPRRPAPDLRGLDGLVASSRRAGLEVSLSCSGELGSLSPAVSGAAYRIVQEALTNVVRHAGVSRASVVVARPGRSLVVEVLDDGAGTPGTPGTPGGDAGPAGGLGLVGIRERAAATGGRCEIGPRPAGGFGVRVRWERAS